MQNIENEENCPISVNYVRKTTLMYRLASDLKKEKRYQEASKLYQFVINRCFNNKQMRKIQGGAYYHLADIAKITNDKQFCREFLEKALIFYPEHGEAKIMLKNFRFPDEVG